MSAAKPTTASMTSRGIVQSDYSEKWSVTCGLRGSLHQRKEGSR